MVASLSFGTTNEPTQASSFRTRPSTENLQRSSHDWRRRSGRAECKLVGSFHYSTGDFQVANGKLELSATGPLRCNGKCSNISALLRLQDDTASTVPNYSPAIFRSKLKTRNQQQQLKLTELVKKMLYVDKGIYRLKARHSGKYLVVDGGSTADNALIEQRGSVSETSADQWQRGMFGRLPRVQRNQRRRCMLLVQRRDQEVRQGSIQPIYVHLLWVSAAFADPEPSWSGSSKRYRGPDVVGAAAGAV